MINVQEECIIRFQKETEYLGNNKPVNQIIPLLSVTIEAYQHKSFIKQCIEGVLMQKTDFSFEIIIGEDGSNDGTREICIEYAEKYPDKIRLFLRNRETSILYDKYGRLLCIFNDVWNKMSARGKYIAWCEGDDYWTDPLKLKKQVDFLENNPEYSMCFHNAKIIYDNGQIESHSFNNLLKNEFNLIEIIKMPWFIPTHSMVYRNDFYELPEWMKIVSGADYALQLLLALKGKFWGFSTIMGVYRKHEGGASSNQPANYTALKKIETLSYFNLYTSFNYDAIIKERIQEINNSLYINALYSRPLVSRIFSADFFAFKTRNLVKRLKSLNTNDNNLNL